MTQPLGSNKGWTLLELLFVLLIIGIIATLAYPAYTQQLTITRRAEAHRLLLEAAAAQERRFALHFNYATELSELDYKRPDTKHYRLKLSHHHCQSMKTVSCYELTAQPEVDSPQKKDAPCQKISINHLGQRAPKACWR